MRIIGLDYGDKTVGVAVSDPFGWTAQGVEVIKRKEMKNLVDTVKRIDQILKEYSTKKIVLGFPIHMNNTQGDRCEKTLYFKNRLETDIPGVEIILKDERLTTISASRLLLEADVSRAKRGKVIDKMAAVLILQGYLDSLNKKQEDIE